MNPAASEICNALDDDCDGATDEACAPPSDAAGADLMAGDDVCPADTTTSAEGAQAENSVAELSSSDAAVPETDDGDTGPEAMSQDSALGDSVTDDRAGDSAAAAGDAGLDGSPVVDADRPEQELDSATRDVLADQQSPGADSSAIPTDAAPQPGSSAGCGCRLEPNTPPVWPAVAVVAALVARRGLRRRVSPRRLESLRGPVAA